MPAVRVSAGWVLPVAGPPIADGAVLAGPDGRIRQVGPDREVPSPPGIRALRFPEAALLPGLVNTHTHLELTGFDGMVEAEEFPDWLRELRALKERRPAEEYLAAARAGVLDCWSAGVTTVADTGDSGAVIQALAELGGSGIAYQEVFGPHPDQLEPSLAGLRRRVAALRRFESDRVRLGVSPHAPYTVSGLLYRETVRWARREGLPIAVHVAESLAEVEFLTAGAGAFAEAWRSRGIPLPNPPCSPIAWLARHDVLCPDTLCIHVIHADPDDLARLAAAGAAVAHCPLSNRRHRHGDARLAAMLAAGLRVGVGTDSVVSVGCLDLLAEARAARALAGVGAETALDLVTASAARAIGLGDRIGTLEEGKWADLAVIRLPAGPGSPVERVLGAGREDVMATFVGGREVFARRNVV